MRPVDTTTLKIVVLPVEHGASVMLGESLLAGLLIAASTKGFLPALGWVFLFLLSNPLKIAVKDISKKIFTPRTKLAVCCAGVLGALALSCFVAVYCFSGPSFLVVLAGVIPLGLMHLWAVVNEGKKEFAAELFGVLSLGAAAASIVLAAGHPYSQALVLWTVLAIRGVTSIIYVRERLSQSRGKINNNRLINLAHIAGVFVLGTLVLAHLIKPLVLFTALLLVPRLWFINQQHTIIPRNLGFQESILGIAYLVLIVFSF